MDGEIDPPSPNLGIVCPTCGMGKAAGFSLCSKCKPKADRILAAAQRAQTNALKEHIFKQAVITANNIKTLETMEKLTHNVQVVEGKKREADARAANVIPKLAKLFAATSANAPLDVNKVFNEASRQERERLAERDRVRAVRRLEIGPPPQAASPPRARPNTLNTTVEADREQADHALEARQEREYQHGLRMLELARLRQEIERSTPSSSSVGPSSSQPTPSPVSSSFQQQVQADRNGDDPMNGEITAELLEEVRLAIGQQSLDDQATRAVLNEPANSSAPR